ncbi:MAG: 3-hydroxymyristoyl/3-hydroxydecanoyl-(acyl carrier protein) dehydratase [Rickettsiales bacterium]|jgi:3-hydroxymyristoyl/3-hydroxydecanoyl-(acyl carrier protein) dehydratase
MKIPTIKKTQEEEGKIELILSFPKNAIYFQGHFPQIKILPGFAQVHFAMHFAQKYWLLKSDLSNIKKLRFTKIITPNTDISLVLENHLPKKITFKYLTGNIGGDISHSSGEIHFDENK